MTMDSPHDHVRDLPLTVSREALLENGSDRKFRSLIHGLLSLADQLVSLRNGFARLLGLSGIQYTILTTIACLQQQRSVRAGELARSLRLSESFLAAEVIRLAELGIVEKSAIKQDQGYALSEQGRNLLERIAPVQRPVNNVLFESLGQDDFRTFAEMVERLSEAGRHASALSDSLHGRVTLLPSGAASRDADIDPRAFRDGLGYFATGVVVVTAEAPNGNRVGLTISSFNSVSLDPPLVLFSIARNVQSLVDLEGSHRYAVNILRSDQRELSDRFSRRGTDKWSDVQVRRCKNGCPRLDQSLAAFECVPYATYDGGDHVIFVGRVVHFETSSTGRPLLFFRGAYANVEEEVASP
jgi:flavin reductase (DIM6/NTAB) family NADH-FMN oxidoreductase RutF/DNA-binding MarR family transcriptional regulator